MELLNAENIIAEIKKATVTTNRAIVEELGKHKEEYEQKIKFLFNANQTLNAENSELQDRLKEQSIINSNLQTQIRELKESLEETNKKIILSKDNQNRAGRPSLTDEEIRLIKEGLAKGFSIRKTAEYANVSHGSVCNHGKDEIKERKDKLTKNIINDHFLTLDECIEKGVFCNGCRIKIYNFLDAAKAYKNAYGKDINFNKGQKENHRIAVNEVNKRIEKLTKEGFSEDATLTMEKAMEMFLDDISNYRIWKKGN